MELWRRSCVFKPENKTTNNLGVIILPSAVAVSMIAESVLVEQFRIRRCSYRPLPKKSCAVVESTQDKEHGRLLSVIYSYLLDMAQSAAETEKTFKAALEYAKNGLNLIDFAFLYIKILF